jgi:pimeloyl-ACP methyl ester carboxylesterase
MDSGDSLFLSVRGLRYHVRTWGSSRARKLFLLHGWMDVSASFQFVVDALKGEWQVCAPDWRGFGLTQWAGTDAYWYADYFADLNFLLDALQPEGPVDLVGHSMGGNIACIYAGVCPDRVGRLVNLEGLGLRDNNPDDSPGRIARWLKDLGEQKGFRPYASFEELASRMRESNPRLSPDRSAFLARHWGVERENGQVELRSDPAHKRVNPVLYRSAEVAACLRRIKAPVLWVEGEMTDAFTRSRLTREEADERRRQIPRSSYRVVAGAGHMMHHDQPESVAALIEEFMA